MKRFLEVCVRELTVRNVNLRFPFSGERRRKNPVVRQGRTVSALRECLSWLLENNCHKVVLESTGSYWIPIWNVLSEGVAVIVVNAEHIKARRGEKTDCIDSRRLAERLRVGDIRGSFVPTVRRRLSYPVPNAGVFAFFRPAGR